MTPNEIDNQTLYRKGQSAGHVESYFMKGNDPASRKAFWLKFTFFAPHGKPTEAEGEVWAVVFDMDDPERHAYAKNVFPIGNVMLGKDGISIEAGPNLWSHGETRGDLKGEAHNIAWDLKFTVDKPTLHHFPKRWMYEGKFPKSKAKSPNPDSRFSGWIDIDGKRWALENVIGMQGHNWGAEHTHRYVWAHCNLFEGVEDVVFEGAAGRVKAGPIVTPFLSMVYLRYKDLQFGPSSFREFFGQKSAMEYYKWTFEVTYGDRRVSGWVDAPNRELVGLAYRNPKGPLTHCLNAKIASAEIVLSEKAGAGWRTLETFQSDRSTALELGVKEPDHGVRMVL